MSSAPRREVVLYWIVTLSFLLPMLVSAAAYWMQPPSVVASITQLGYPVSLLWILGTAKPLGAFFILIGKYPRLKEWAYAGFTINFLGASASHLLAGDPIVKTLFPLVFWMLSLGSYGLWRRIDGRAPRVISS